jgi:hypothetical protein
LENKGWLEEAKSYSKQEVVVVFEIPEELDGYHYEAEIERILGLAREIGRANPEEIERILHKLSP